MVGIRVDVNDIVATGHCMRCIAIASALQRFGIEPFFITADEQGKEFVNAKGYAVKSLNTRWNALDQELEVLIGLLYSQGIDRILVDTYQVTPTYLTTLSTHVKVLYMDDLGAFSYPVQAVCNYNIYADRMNYNRQYTNRQTKLFLGTQYVPLRHEFMEEQQEKSNSLPVILFSSGGGNNTRIGQALLYAISKDNRFEDTSMQILQGPYSDKLIIPRGMKNQVVINQNVSNIAELMKQCDVAVTAAGMTMYEICACGLPAVSFTLADNQWLGAVEFDRLGLIPYCGDVRDSMDECIQNILNELMKLLNNKDLRSDKSIAMHSLIDGKGAERIARELLYM